MVLKGVLVNNDVTTNSKRINKPSVLLYPAHYLKILGVGITI